MGARWLLFRLFSRGKRLWFSLGLVVSVFLLALSVAMTVGINGVLSGYEETFEKLLFSYYPHVWIQAKAGHLRADDVDKILAFVRGVNGVAVAKPALITESKIKVAFYENEAPFTVSIIVYGVDLSGGQGVIRIADLVGREVVSRLGDGGGYNIVVNRSFYEQIEGGDGGEASLVPVRTKNVEIVGVVDAPLMRGRDFLMMEISKAQELLSMSGKVTDVQVRLEGVQVIARVADEIRQGLGELQVKVYDLESAFKENRAIVKLQKNIVFVVVAMFVFYASGANAFFLFFFVRTRTREIAMLRCSGVTVSLLSWSIVYFNLAVCFLGVSLGLPLGVALAEFATAYNAEVLRQVFYATEDIAVKFDIQEISLYLSFVVLSMLLSGLAPVWKVSRLSLATELRVEQ